MWKRRLVWALLLAAAALWYFFDNRPGSAAAAGTVLLLPLLSGLGLALRRPRLAASPELPGTAEPGRTVEGRLRLTHTPLLCAVSCTLALENRFTGGRGRMTVTRSFGGAENALVPFSLRPPHCGQIRCRVDCLRVTEPFGLFSRRLPAHGETRMTVLPLPRQVEVLPAQTGEREGDSLRWSVQRPGLDPGETFQIRAYVPGDPLRQIHWKLSQKTDKLLVREFGLPVEERLLLLFETTRLPGTDPAPELTDALVRLLFALCAALIAAELPPAVCWYDHDSRQLCRFRPETPEDLEALQEALLSSPVAEGSCTVPGAYAREDPVCGYAHTVVLSSAPEPELALLDHGGRLTLLLPGQAAADMGLWSEGAEVIPFDPEGPLTLEL